MRENLQQFLLAIVLIGSLIGLTASAQDEFHQFSNKDGQKIEAKIVSVTPDLKTMKIQRRDGRDFEMAINVLSLDDQLIVKKWLTANPNAARIDYNLDVSIEKKAKTAKNERDSYYKYKTTNVSYEVTIKNRTRQDLAGARADYVVLLENAVKIYRSASGRPETYDSGDSGEVAGTIYVRKSSKLPEALPFNHDHTFLTEPVEHEEITADGNISYGEDKVLGVILRVIGSKDEVIGEYRSNEPSIQKVTWDQVKGRGFASNSTQPAGSTPATPDPPEPTPATPTPLETPEWLEVRNLDSWPELLQKGDTVRSRNMPKWGNKEVQITAFVDIDEDNSGGVIVACGGSSKGFSLFVLNGALHFWSRKAYKDNRTEWLGIKVPLSEVPKEECKVDAEFDAETLKLWIDGELKAEGDSVGLLNFRPQEGLSVGYDSENSAVGGGSAPHPFRGSIRDVGVKFEAP